MSPSARRMLDKITKVLGTSEFQSIFLGEEPEMPEQDSPPIVRRRRPKVVQAQPLPPVPTPPAVAPTRKPKTASMRARPKSLAPKQHPELASEWQEAMAAPGYISTMMRRGKSQAKPGSVTWWPMEMLKCRRQCKNPLKPRDDGGNIHSSIVVNDITVRFMATQHLLTSSQARTTSSTVENTFELEYQRMERDIVKGLGCDIDLSTSDQTEQSASSRRSGSSTAQSKERRSAQDSSEEYIDVAGSSSSSGTLSTAPSYGTSVASSRAQSSACSVILDEEGEIDTVGIHDSLEAASDPESDGLSPGTRSGVVSKAKPAENEKDQKSAASETSKRPAKRKVSEDTCSSSRNQEPKYRSELEKLQVWTIKNSHPTESIRNRSKLRPPLNTGRNRGRPQTQAQTQPQQRARKRLKTELEVLSEWTIKNSLLDVANDEDSGRMTRSAREQLAKQGTKRPIAQITEDDSKSVSSKVDNSKRRKAVQTRSVRKIRKPKSLSTKSAPSIDGDKPSGPAGASRELVGLLRWTIKNSTVDVDATTQAKIRTIRNPTEPVAQNTTSKAEDKGTDEEKAESEPGDDTPSEDRRSIRRLLKQVSTKAPNTTTPKYKVGDEIMAPAEDDLLFDATILAIRDHKSLHNVFEYRIHYAGYSSRFDVWMEEKLLETE
ncbi:MAG: hypothetical protein J3Q66DRAFT_361234 [Benniella sp.]|nr:MAG: hypothetical protein J3Q66DRAFT_361234 [Benniella sp.]